MEHGKLERAAFMARIRELTREIVSKAKNFESDVVEGNYVTLDVRCPKCGAPHLKEDYRTYRCKTCGYRLYKNIASRELSPEEAAMLLAEGKIGPLEGFRSRFGKPFSAALVLNEEKKPEFVFENNGSSESIVIDPDKHAGIGPCQVCADGQVYDIGTAYVCQNVAKRACTFKLSKTIRQREIPPDQMRKMLVTGKSDVLQRFISKKGRPFDAALTLKKGKLGWEFAKRARPQPAAGSDSR
jgi:DNA topoisomerase-3